MDQEEEQQESPADNPQEKANTGGNKLHDTIGRAKNASALLGPEARAILEGADLLTKEGRKEARKKFLNRVLIGFGIASIVILLFILIFGGGDDTADDLSTLETVSLNKTGPASVKNDELITYTLNATYSTNTTSVTIIDPIPENAEFATASGNFTLEKDGEGKVTKVIWSLQNSSLQTRMLAENSTITNLGFGPSDGARIDAMIQKLHPKSPLVGHGDTVVALAKEFNLDPLMVIIMDNESQMCTDNGVVSPGGSDPDNYNCGGILWGTAQGTDVARWHVKSGPQANGHIFAFVPSVDDGLGLFFNYIGKSKLYPGKSLPEFYNIYNPCNDPGNQGRFACGSAKGEKILEQLKDIAGPASDGSGSFVGGGATEETVTITLKAKEHDTYIINQATAETTGGINDETSYSATGEIAALLPNPLPPDSPEGVAAKEAIINRLKSTQTAVEVYKQASSKTGVPWQVLAGLHDREGSGQLDKSLTSGRTIGENEPDIVAGEGCSSQRSGPGIPIALPGGGCGFNSLLDSAIWSANHLKGKLGHVPGSFPELVTALSRYNGGGNANCGKGVPYKGCPAAFPGEDDPYAMSLFAQKYSPMYIIYCADYTRCAGATPDSRPGTATVAKWVATSF